MTQKHRNFSSKAFSLCKIMSRNCLKFFYWWGGGYCKEQLLPASLILVHVVLVLLPFNHISKDMGQVVQLAIYRRHISKVKLVHPCHLTACHLCFYFDVVKCKEEMSLETKCNNLKQKGRFDRTSCSKIGDELTAQRGCEKLP